MGKDCCEHVDEAALRVASYRRILWAALAINAVMFITEIGAGLLAGSAALQADALDFLGDTASYGISLLVAGMALRYRAMAALLKGSSMAVFGIWVVGITAWHVASDTLPAVEAMGTVGALALVANMTCFALLWRYRAGDSNMRSVWICSRNDALGNVAVLMAAAGVFGTGAGWPDAVVAAVEAVLALQGAWTTIRSARGELRDDHAGHARLHG